MRHRWKFFKIRVWYSWRILRIQIWKHWRLFKLNLVAMLLHLAWLVDKKEFEKVVGKAYKR